MNLTVIGGGIVGLWIAAEAVTRGFKVRLLEQFDIGHDRGSSHGDTRIFRSAYWEGKEYVNLARKSIPMWEWLNSISPETVFNLIGGYYAGAANSSLISGVNISANTYSLPISKIELDSLSVIALNAVGIEEKFAGVIYADKVLSILKQFCLDKGVTIYENSRFENKEYDGIYIYCIGPWFCTFPKISNFLTSNRVYCHWFSHNGESPLFKKAFLMQGKDKRVLYGMPTERYVVKVGWHNYPIIPLSPGTPENTSPKKYVCDIEEALSKITSQKLKYIKSKGCYFTNSLDENYIIDKIENDSWVVAGLSGHGFKFAPALAASVLDSIEGNSLCQELRNFSLDRFCIKNIASRTYVSESDLLLGSLWEI